MPQQARKALDEVKSLLKQYGQSQDEVTTAQAAALLADTPESDGRRVVVRSFAGRDMGFVKMIAQKLTDQSPLVIALLATLSPQPTLVFAQSPGQPYDMGALMKEAMSKLGGRGGGSKDLAQGGVPNTEGIEGALDDALRALGTSSS